MGRPACQRFDRAFCPSLLVLCRLVPPVPIAAVRRWYSAIDNKTGAHLHTEEEKQSEMHTRTRKESAQYQPLDTACSGDATRRKTHARWRSPKPARAAPPLKTGGNGRQPQKEETALRRFSRQRNKTQTTSKSLDCTDTQTHKYTHTQRKHKTSGCAFLVRGELLPCTQRERNERR